VARRNLTKLECHFIGALKPMLNKNKTCKTEQTGLHRLLKVLLKSTNSFTIHVSPFVKPGSFGFFHILTAVVR
jgi:hypothetical protein